MLDYDYDLLLSYCDYDYRVVPGHRNRQIETAARIWPTFFHSALETRRQGVRKPCGKGLY